MINGRGTEDIQYIIEHWSRIRKRAEQQHRTQNDPVDDIWDFLEVPFLINGPGGEINDGRSRSTTTITTMTTNAP